MTDTSNETSFGKVLIERQQMVERLIRLVQLRYGTYPALFDEYADPDAKFEQFVHHRGFAFTYQVITKPTFAELRSDGKRIADFTPRWRIEIWYKGAPVVCIEWRTLERPYVLKFDSAVEWKRAIRGLLRWARLAERKNDALRAAKMREHMEAALAYELGVRERAQVARYAGIAEKPHLFAWNLGFGDMTLDPE